MTVRNTTAALPPSATYAGRVSVSPGPVILSDRQLDELYGLEVAWCHVWGPVEGTTLCGERDAATPHVARVVNGRCAGCGRRKCPDCVEAWGRRL